MRTKYFAVLLLYAFVCFNGQKLQTQTLLKDRISIRTVQIWEGKVFYAGTDSRFGYVSLKDSTDKKQLVLSDQKLEFRALAQSRTQFHLVNVGSPAYFFTVSKKTLQPKLVYTDTIKSTFFDSFVIDKYDRGLAISDPLPNGTVHPFFYTAANLSEAPPKFAKYLPGEAHFAASNSNIAMKNGSVWMATGGAHARIFKFSWNRPLKWEIYTTPFIQGTDSQGIYSIDFYDKNRGIAVGGDYKNQGGNVNNIATTTDGGKTWKIQASGSNAGYKTCVKYRPGSGARELISLGDQNVEYSNDSGKTWRSISEEKNLYVFEWVDRNTLVLAGKNKILKAVFVEK